jgi:hypothetical protein
MKIRLSFNRLKRLERLFHRGHSSHCSHCRRRNPIGREILCAGAIALFVLLPGNAFGMLINSAGEDALDSDWTVGTCDADDKRLETDLIASQSPGSTGFNGPGFFEATGSSAIQYSTMHSGGNDRELIDDFSYAVPVPEPNVGMLLGLGLLTLAGSRFRQQAAVAIPVAHRRPDSA